MNSLSFHLVQISPVTSPRTGGTIFTTRAGTTMIPGNVMKRYVRPACVKLGILFSGFHDCRHTAVTRLLNDGVSAKTVARIAGHSDVRITLNTYAHVESEQMEAPLAQLSCALVVPNSRQAA